ncbi:MAG: purine-binding chemotaxis protein CheW [Rhodocyclaceae bacterium]|nr:purine-binding chemotaxis protein CheW [Rhodocyclaceae bacterium]
MSQLVQAKKAPPVALEEATGANQHLTFALGGEMFAVDILHVKEIIEYGAVTEIPMMPVFIRGVINLRGSVVPVVDLSARFGARRTVVGRRTCIVIIEVSDGVVDQDVGIVVDAVSEVLEIAAADIEPPPSFGARIRADFIAGMAKVEGSFVILVDIDKVLDANEIAEIAAGDSAREARLPPAAGEDAAAGAA